MSNALVGQIYLVTEDDAISVNNLQLGCLVGVARALCQTGGLVWATGKSHVTVTGGQAICFDSSDALVISGRAACYGNSTAVGGAESNIELHDRAKGSSVGGDISLFQESKAMISGNAKGIARGQSQVTVKEGATVSAYDKAQALVADGGFATLHDYATAIVNNGGCVTLNGTLCQASVNDLARITYADGATEEQVYWLSGERPERIEDADEEISREELRP